MHFHQTFNAYREAVASFDLEIPSFNVNTNVYLGKVTRPLVLVIAFHGATAVKALEPLTNTTEFCSFSSVCKGFSVVHNESCTHNSTDQSETGKEPKHIVLSTAKKAAEKKPRDQ